MTHKSLTLEANKADAAGFKLRREGFDIRDCLSVQTNEGPRMSFLGRKMRKDTVLEETLRLSQGTLDIDAGRISTEDSLKRPVYAGTGNPDRWRTGNKTVTTGSSSGRFPSNFFLIHGPSCKCEGTKKVKNKSGSVSGKEPSALTKHSYGDYRDRPEFRAYGDSDGTEEVPDWNCQPDCPVRIIDLQSGELENSFRTTRDHQGGQFGWKAGNAPGYDESGGASRFFYQAIDLKDLLSYIKAVTKQKDMP